MTVLLFFCFVFFLFSSVRFVIGPAKSLCAAMETRGHQFHQELVGGSEASLLTMMLNIDAVTKSRQKQRNVLQFAVMLAFPSHFSVIW